MVSYLKLHFPIFSFSDWLSNEATWELPGRYQNDWDCQCCNSFWSWYDLWTQPAWAGQHKRSEALWLYHRRKMQVTNPFKTLLHSIFALNKFALQKLLSAPFVFLQVDCWQWVSCRHLTKEKRHSLRYCWETLECWSPRWAPLQIQELPYHLCPCRAWYNHCSFW